MKKKMIALGLSLLFIMVVGGCKTGKSIIDILPSEVLRPATPADALDQLLSTNSNVTKVISWVGDTNSNGIRYAESSYSDKADFSDKRVSESNDTENRWEYGLKGGTLEYFISKDNCEKRYADLKAAAFNASPEGLNQYIFKYDKAIFRVSYDLSPDIAKEYQNEMDAILREDSIMYVFSGDSGGLSAKDALDKLEELNGNVSITIEYTTESDPLNRIGKLGYYTSKACFYDATIKSASKATNNYEEDEFLKGGMLEIFDSESGCESRCNYILKNIPEETLTIRENNSKQPLQYIYKYKKALFRLSYSLTLEQANKYKEEMDSILGEESEVKLSRGRK